MYIPSSQTNTALVSSLRSIVSLGFFEDELISSSLITTAVAIRPLEGKTPVITNNNDGRGRSFFSVLLIFL